MSNIGFIDWNAFDPDAFLESINSLTVDDVANIETDLNQGVINLNKNPELASTPAQQEYVRTNVNSRQTSTSNNNPAPIHQLYLLLLLLLDQQIRYDHLVPTTLIRIKIYNPVAEMYKGDGAFSTGATKSSSSNNNPGGGGSRVAQASQKLGQGATANPPGEFPSDRYSAASK